MPVLVVGASGATGRLLVEQLLKRGCPVKAVVRRPEALPEALRQHAGLTVLQASLLDLDVAELAQHVDGCTAVASCLGHNLSFKGILGPPYRLVAEATRRLCAAIQANKPKRPVRFVLMNTAGNSNRDIPESVSFGERCVLVLIRTLLPPHADNEQAADFLRLTIGQRHPAVEWAVVRPDTLLNLAEVTPYDIHKSPTRSAIFDPGKTSRINVAHFMAELIANDDLWQTWQGQMPVIYNRE